MSGGHPGSFICSHGVASLASLLMPSTARFCFFIDKLQLPPNATKASSAVFLSLSHRSSLKALGSRAESPPSLPALDSGELPTVSYLVTSGGLSPETALCATKIIGSNKRENALAVIQLLRSYDFSDAQIDKIVSKRSIMLVSNVERNLKPKLDFLLGEGFSTKEVTDIFTANYTLFRRNIERGLIATYRFLSATLRSRSDVIISMKGGNQCLTFEHEPKLKMLRDNGVPEHIVLHLVKLYPMVLMRRLERLEEGVKTLLELGVNVETKMFCYSLRVVSYVGRNALFKKMKLYQELGWTESQVIVMLKSKPLLLTLDDKLIRYKMDFFMEKLGWEREFIIRYPKVLHFSIEGRILPRVSTLKVLTLKGLNDKEAMYSQFMSDDKWFFERYVKKFKDEVPGIIQMYEDANALQEN